VDVRGLDLFRTEQKSLEVHFSYPSMTWL
jgi:hypothetical protein